VTLSVKYRHRTQSVRQNIPPETGGTRWNGEKALCEKDGVAAVNFHSGEKKVLNLVPPLSGGMFM